MNGSCCGHGKLEGSIILADGRWLVILDPELAREYWTKYSTDNGQTITEAIRSWVQVRQDDAAQRAFVEEAVKKRQDAEAQLILTD